jgi:hypothetical protein
MDSLSLIKDIVDNLTIEELMSLRHSLISVQSYVHTDLNGHILDIVRARIVEKLK